jgi:hypothetical protein
LDETGSDTASDSGSENVDLLTNSAAEFENPLTYFKQNAWLSSKLNEMIEFNRR